MVVLKLKKVLSRLNIIKEKPAKSPFSDVKKEVVIDTRYPIERIRHEPIKVKAPATIEPTATREVKLVKVEQKRKKSKARIKLPKIKIGRRKRKN